MTDNTSVERKIRISTERAERLSQLAQAHQLSEDRVVEKALDILFSLADLLGGQTERRGWSFLSENTLAQVWNNDQDARYDNWRALYGVPAGGVLRQGQ